MCLVKKILFVLSKAVICFFGTFCHALVFFRKKKTPQNGESIRYSYLY